MSKTNQTNWFREVSECSYMYIICVQRKNISHNVQISPAPNKRMKEFEPNNLYKIRSSDSKTFKANSLVENGEIFLHYEANKVHRSKETYMLKPKEAQKLRNIQTQFSF